MSASQALGGQSRCGRVIGPSLDKIIKNAAWRKHSAVVAACKAALDKLETIAAPDGPVDLASPLVGLSLADANFVLHPLVLALDAAYGKIAEPALECAFKLFSFNLIHAEIVDSSDPSSVTAPLRLIHGACKSGGIGEEAVELAVLRVLLAAVRSPSVLIRGDCLVHIVKTCYNVYLGGQNGTNQICAKSVLAQIMVIAFARVEADAMDVTFKTVSVSELLEFTDKNLNEGSSIHFCQNFVSEVVDANDGATENNNLELSISSESQNGDGALKDDEKVQVSEGESNGVKSAPVGSKIREDGYMLFKNLCKLSMKFSSQEQTDDQILLRGKILSLELLKVIMDVGGPIWRSDERFLSAIKQFLCLSLLKNSALSVMAIFQLQCCIFMSLLTKYRPGLKAEIGIFFPMLILRVLENILQPSFLQKMTVLNLLEKMSQDPQLIIDVFVNYDCDVDSPNIFERIVNGLHKTALGPPAGSATTLSPAQDVTFHFESVKCLVRIIMSMGTWMDQQLKIGYSNHHSRKESEADLSLDSFSIPSGEDGTVLDYDEANSESSDATTLEQRRTYKMELQKGVMLFNRKPSKGVEFLISTKKVGSSPEEVAAFLKNAAIGLSETTIGDYLGERDDFPLKVMHAYVDSFNFIGMDFGEAIRFFLRGFRLPGEAQKIDRIMEKFAERYCKCHPNSFTSADTAYVLAYSVIMLNTDAHNNMVKDKMSKADFIRNNRGIDDGKDLPEEFLSNLYDHIVRHEIKMSSDSSAQQSKQANSLNKLLGLDGILNLVTGKQSEEKALGANGLLIRHIQEQFKAKSGKTESIYHSVTDLAILRFMVEVCWGPMLAAFSVTLDQSDDKLATAQCLQGFRSAVHVTAVMGMQTQRDAFMTSVAKFTYLHNAADMKQKNVDAVKAIIAIAIEDGNHLQEAWEHILTCLSRIEHLQLLGEGAPTDASFFTAANGDTDERALKAAGFSSYKKKGTIQNSAVMAVVRGGSYDSTTTGVNASGLVSPEQINNFISNLNLLDQIGNFELNHVFAHSQRLNSDGIVAFVRALCKVSMAELQSLTDPRVFSLTKLVEIAHYNMNRIRLVWTRIWNVLSDFFVSVGLSENLSVAIFVMDSLRQLAMKFLEREELANYNFQNEFLRPFVIIMQKSGSAEIRELIVRCISQMVLTRVNHVKSGWKSVFLIFTAAAADERKNIVQLAFETIEKIVREYFPYITETETTTFTDCVRCLLAFTTSRFNSDVSLNAIAFLRFCAVKLAEDGLASKDKIKDIASAATMVSEVASSNKKIMNDKDDNASYWVPLLAGLAKLTSDSRKAIRKSSLEVLFNILKDHGHLFSTQFWEAIYKSILFPIFTSASDKIEGNINDEEETSSSPSSSSPRAEGSSTWDTETSSIAAKLLVELTVTFFPLVRSQLPGVVSVLTGFIKSPVQGTASTGVAAMVRLGDELGSRLGDEEWRQIYTGLKEAAETSVPGLLKLLGLMENIDFTTNSEVDHYYYSSDQGLIADEIEDDNLQTAAYVISRMKSHIAVQLLIIQVVTDLYTSHPKSLSEQNITILLSMFSSISSHSNRLSSNKILQKKLQRACSILDLSEPPLVHFENETHQNHLTFLKTLTSSASPGKHMDIESQLVTVCTDIIHIYLNCIGSQYPPLVGSARRAMHWVLPLGSAVKEELAARTTLIVAALEVVSGFDRGSFRRHAGRVFPLLVELVRSEHSSGEVQEVITNIFESCIGPILMES